ncbi:putative SPOR domain-containing protein [Gammaproteobacteria bacterium]
MTTNPRKPSPPPDYKPSLSSKKPKPSKPHAAGWFLIMIGMSISMMGAAGYQFWNRPRHVDTAITTATPASTAPSNQEAGKAGIKPSTDKVPVPTGKEPATANAPEARKEAARQPKPRPVIEGTSNTSFDFYKLLPDMKVGETPEIPGDPANKPVVKEVSVPKPVAKDSSKPVVKESPKPPVKETTTRQLSPPTPKDSAKNPARTTSSTTIYMLQAGAFRTSEEASRLRANLAFKGLESTTQIVGAGTAEVWHRVRLGPFQDFNQAARIQQNLREEHIPVILSREYRN